MLDTWYQWVYSGVKEDAIMLVEVHPDVVTLLARFASDEIAITVGGTREKPILNIDDDTYDKFQMLCEPGESVADFLYDRLYRKLARHTRDVLKN